MKNLSSIVPGIFMLVVAVLAGILIHRVAATPTNGPYKSDKQVLVDYNRCLQLATTASGAMDAKLLQRCAEDLTKTSAIDDYSKARLDEMRWMLTIIGSLAAFFVIAQSASAYFTAQSYRQSADETIARMKDQEANVRAIYLLFSEVTKNREKAYLDLRQALRYASKIDDPAADPLEALGFLDNFYKQMSVEKRQRLLSVESFASIDLDPAPLGEDAHAKDLVLLAVFYHSKFLFESRLNRGWIADLERAESYFRLAFAKSNFDFTILNELALLYISFHKVCGGRRESLSFLQKAEAECHNSLRLQPDQQRPYYNLAAIEGRYRKNYANARKHLTDALQHDNWQRIPVKYTKSFIYYNLACYGAMQLAPPLATVRLAEAKEVVENLEKAAAFHAITREIITNDMETPSGDLFLMVRRANPTLAAELKRVRELLLEQATTPPPPTNFWRAVKEGLKLIKATLPAKPIT